MKKLILLTIMFAALSCSAQQKTSINNKNNKKMEHFNIEQFDKNCGETSEYRYTNEHGMEIYQSYVPLNSGDQYWVECTYPNNPYRYQYIYNDEGNLVEKTTFFFAFPVGERIKYDNMGNVTENIDCDAPYKFSLEKLKEKMQKEYNVNILDKKKIHTVERYVDRDDNNRPYYEVYVYQANPLEMVADVYLIDGVTGEILLKTTRADMLEDGQGNEESVFDEYLRKSGKQTSVIDDTQKSDKKGLWANLSS